MQILDLSNLHSSTFFHQKLVTLFQVNNYTSKRFLLYGTSQIDLLQNCYTTSYFLENSVM